MAVVRYDETPLFVLLAVLGLVALAVHWYRLRRLRDRVRQLSESVDQL